MVASKKKAAGRAPKANLAARSATDALAEAAWADADLALAQALAEFDEARQARGGAREDAMAMLGLSLARAARKRGLTRLGKAGAQEKFDSSRHDVAGHADGAVEILVPGVERCGEVLVRARARKAP